MLADYEARNPLMPFFNQKARDNVLPTRSVEGIKGQRRSVKYRQLLNEAKERLQAGGTRSQENVIRPVQVRSPISDPTDQDGAHSGSPEELVSSPGEVSQGREGNKIEFSIEDLRAMALLEDGNRGRPRINMLIQRELFPTATLKGIAAQRKKVFYRDLLEGIRLARAYPMDDIDLSLDSSTTDSEADDGLPHPILTTPPIETRIPIMTAGPGLPSEAELDTLQVEIFGSRPRRAPGPMATPGNAGDVASVSKRRRRRKQFAATQRMWRKNRAKAAQTAIAGRDPLARPTFPPGTVEFWGGLFSRSSPALNDENREGPSHSGTLVTIMDPISTEDVKWCKAKTSLSTAPGPDGVTPKDFRAVPDEEVRDYYNLVLMSSSTRNWARGRTTLLPKSDSPRTPGEYRPITVTSVVTRGLHKILAKRLADRMPTSARQKGFKAEEGVSANILILKNLLSQAKKEQKSLFLAYIDFKKAFDSIGHPQLLRILQSSGLDRDSCAYLSSFYDKISTEILGQSFDIKRGVMQGDPISPLLFNVALDHALKRLPSGVGATLEGTQIQYLAFADDIVVVATTREGLNTAVETLLSEAGKIGLEPGLGKCATTNVTADPRRKTWYCDLTPFKHLDEEIPVVGPEGFYKYLGVEMGLQYTPETGNKLIARFKTELGNLQRALLKPQQKMWSLTNILIPRFQHCGLHNDLRRYHFEGMDRQCRDFVRKALHLPRDTPKAAFHAALAAGGLGIYSFVNEIPKAQINMCDRLMNSPDPLVVTLASRKKRDLPAVTPVNWEELLHQSVDGMGLRESSTTPKPKWLYSGNRLVKGGTYCMMVKLRQGVLSTPARSARGRDVTGRCDLGCHLPGTQHHIQQVCPRVQGWRIKRHDRIKKKIKEHAVKKGYTALDEPRLQTSQGLRKPDLVIYKEDTAYVLDCQVTSDSNVSPLESLHQRKVDKYNNDEIKEQVRLKIGLVPEVEAITLNWRGQICRRTADLLKQLLGLTSGDLDLLSVACMEGSIQIYSNYMGMSGGGDVT